MGHAAGADEGAPETFVIEAGGKAGDAEVVGPEGDDYVGGDGVVLELEIVPDDAGGTEGGLVHLVSLSQDGGPELASGFALRSQFAVFRGLQIAAEIPRVQQVGHHQEEAHLK